MKKKVLAALLAICMIAGTCTLFASAAQETYAKRNDCFGEEIAGKTYFDVSKLDKVTAKKHKIVAKEDAELAASATKIDKKNITDLVSFDPSFDADIFDVSAVDNETGGAIGPGTTDFKIKIKVKENKQWLYRVKATNGLQDESATVSSADKIVTTDDRAREAWHTIIGGTNDYEIEIIVTDVERVEQLTSFQMGIRMYGDSSYKNLRAKEIAIIEAYVDRDSNYYQENSDGFYTPTGSEDTKANDYRTYADTIYDLGSADQVILTTYLKDPKEQAFYKFYGWVDGNGKVLQKVKDEDAEIGVNGTKKYSARFASNAGAVYAAYIEIADRVMINFTSTGKGKFQAFEGNEQREYTKIGGGGDSGVVSVMVGRDVTFTFTPDEGYEVGQVTVDGVRIISLSNLAGKLLEAWKEIVAATNRDALGAQQTTGTYTFKNIQARNGDLSKPHEIKVEFVKTAVLTAPEGLEMETIEAEGLTLATGAAGENKGD